MALVNPLKTAAPASGITTYGGGKESDVWNQFYPKPDLSGAGAATKAVTGASEIVPQSPGDASSGSEDNSWAKGVTPAASPLAYSSMSRPEQIAFMIQRGAQVIPRSFTGSPGAFTPEQVNAALSNPFMAAYNVTPEGLATAAPPTYVSPWGTVSKTPY